MISIPPNIQVDRDEETEKTLMAAARKWLLSGERTEGIHASDLLMPLRAFWKHLDPKPITDREAGLFLVGKLLHAFVLSRNGSKSVNIGLTDEGSVYHEDLGLWYSPDKLFEDTSGSKRPMEFKTNRGMYPAKTVGDLETYIKQLLIYMAAEKALDGEILVLYTNAKDESGKTSPQFRSYKVHLAQEELEAVTLDVKRVRDQLARAIAGKNPGGLPLCPAWICHPEQCEWWSKCKPAGRYENFEYLKGKRK